MSEISEFATLVLVVAAGFSLAALSTKFTERIPVPAPAIFLVAAAVVADLSPAVEQAIEIKTVERIAVVALIVILFNGGAEIGVRRFRASAWPILSVGIFGTFATAGAVAAFAHFVLGMDWTLAGLLGAAVAPTDPAVMFSVLGRREIAGRSGTTLEGEAGVNDPAGIALMIGMIEIATSDHASLLAVAREFGLEMGIGTVFGLVGGRVVVALLRRVHLPSEAMYPVLTLMVAGVLYGATSLASGSGFLAVFLAGLLLGDARVPYKGEIDRFQASLASFAELAVFVGLGLTVELSSLGSRAWLEGAAVAGVLALVVRPVVVFATLQRADLSRNERLFISWSGLKGAVPILLAAFAVLANADGAQRLYGLVFVVVLISVVGQGTLVPYVAGRLGIPMRVADRTPWDISIRLQGEPGAQEYEVRAGSRAVGQQIRDLSLGADAWVTLVVRNGSPLEADASLELEAGDRLLVLADPMRTAPVAALFRPAAD